MNFNIYNDGIGKVELVQFVGSDLTVVNSARVSFGAEQQELHEKDKKLINYLIKHKHTSTLEHCSVTFRIKVPLFVRSQHHRHRTWSYNEISRRYTGINLEFYEPQKFRTQHKSNRQASNIDELIDPKIEPKTWGSYKCSDAILSHHKSSVELYELLLSAGICREQARGVLPQNLYTEYYATANLNNILKFISLRTHTGAQWEIQVVANAMLKILESLFPITVNAYLKNFKA